jgi:hypothetical protein
MLKILVPKVIPKVMMYIAKLEKVSKLLKKPMKNLKNSMVELKILG